MLRASSLTAARVRPWLVLTVTATAYLIAVMQRSSLGIAAVAATERFAVAATQLSILAVAQLAVYTVMQIPVGLLLDRYGAKRLLIFGATMMALGQLLLAFVPELWMAVIARMLVGFGDAFTFISLIRMINGWYRGKRAAALQQLLANLGQFGQVLSAVPVALALASFGWSVTFASLAAVSVLIVLALWVWVRDDAEQHEARREPEAWAQVFENLRVNLRDPAVRLAFWTHFTTQSPTSAFVLLWGVPFLVSSQGLGSQEVSLVLSLIVLVAPLFGGLLALAAAQKPSWRPVIFTSVVVAVMLYWAVLLVLGGPLPIWMLLILAVILGASGPASMLAFDFSRSLVPKYRLGSANGFINVGGFLATLVLVFLVGVLLDLAKALNPVSPLYSIAGFQLAFWATHLVLGFGLLMFWVETRRLYAKQGGRERMASHASAE